MPDTSIITGRNFCNQGIAYSARSGQPPPSVVMSAVTSTANAKEKTKDNSSGAQNLQSVDRQT